MDLNALAGQVAVCLGERRGCPHRIHLLRRALRFLLALKRAVVALLRRLGRHLPPVLGAKRGELAAGLPVLPRPRLVVLDDPAGRPSGARYRRRCGELLGRLASAAVWTSPSPAATA